ncbi:MAG: preprotein translocase subunit YajC [Actinomycetota bacterium]
MPHFSAHLANLAAAKSSSSGVGFLLPLILIFAAGYFLIIRPNKQRQAKQRETTTSLEVGDKIATIGGIVGIVVELDDEHVTIQSDGGQGSRLTVLRQGIGRKIDPVDPPSAIEPPIEPDATEQA